MSFKIRKTATNWLRFALKCGLLVTDAKIWSAVNDMLDERASAVRDSVKQQDEELREKIRTHDVIRSRGRGLAHAAAFVGGVGMGVGLGILFAPVSGEQAREIIRDKAADLTSDVKKKVSDIASRVSRKETSMPGGGLTGTYTD
jgi:gas vesicle protein